jgi:hypothetical protein
MKNNFLFTFALLAILCMVNAFPHRLYKRTTTFGECPINNSTSLLLLTVAISPDPVIPQQNTTFTVNGTLTTPITSDLGLVIAFLDSGFGLIDTPFSVQIPLGTAVNVVEQVLIPNLPSQYAIAVWIGKTPLAPSVIIACTMASVGFNSNSALLDRLY